MVATVTLIIIGSFFLFNLFLFFFPLRKRKFFTNEERAEEYIYSKGTYSTVFVGSGLIGNLPNTGSNRIFNFFLPYSGACTGVEILARSSKIPKVLLVEINCIFKGYDEKFIKNLFKPINYWLKFFFPLLQRKHHILSVLKLIIRRLRDEKVVMVSKLPQLDYNQLEMFRKFYNQPPKEIQIAGNIGSLKKFVDKIGAKNCMVIFFEMPMDGSITNSLLAKRQKTELKTTFPADKYAWIEPNPTDIYYTEDGIHLLEESALRYSDYLYANLKRITSATSEG